MIVHEATRTGSPRVLHDLLRQARARLDRPVAIRLLAGGPMTAQLEALGDVDPTGVSPAAVLINSSLAADAAWQLDPGVPVAVYVHEQGEALRTLPDRAAAALRDRCTQVWCVSASARSDLTALGVAPERIRVLPPVVGERHEQAGDADEHRRLLGIAPTARLVVGCGEANWRKGADLFLDVARRLSSEPDVHFVWIGRRPRAFARILDHDTRHLSLTDRLVWTGELPDPSELLADAAVLVVTSREDPQPLVPLEAGLAGTPSVGFAVGGMVDMSDAGAAITVPYPDTAALANATRTLLHDAGTAEALAAAAATRARTRHSLQATAAQFEDLVARLVQGLAPEGTA